MFVNLELYRIFYYVAKSGSLSKASDELFVSQPAISQSIKQLEEKMENQLFFRTPKGVTLTQEGQMLYHYIEQAYHLILAGEKKVWQIKNLLDGEIRIGASDTLCKYYLLPFLETFHAAHPAVKMLVTNRTTPEIIDMLKNGKVDLGIINLPVEDSNLVIQKGIAIHDCFVVGESYKELAQSTHSFHDLKDFPVLMLERCSNTRKFMDSFLESKGVVITQEIELGSIELLVQFARIGLGISHVIREFIRDELEHNALYELQFNQPIPTRHVGVITLKNIPMSKAAKEFISLLSSSHHVENHS